MKKNIDGRKYGYDGDFVVSTWTFGRWADMMDDISEATTKVVDGVLDIKPKQGAFQGIRVLYGLTDAPIPITMENIREFPLALIGEIEEAIKEVNPEASPFGDGADGKETP